MQPPTMSVGPVADEPLHPDLVGHLLTAGPDDPVVRHVLAVLSGYAYSDEATVAEMAARLGLGGARVVRLSQLVDAMFVSSTAYVVQSADGRVVLVVYRGTEPTSVVSWLTDLDVDPDLVGFDLETDAGVEEYAVHAGFYRNVRATRGAVVARLAAAVAGAGVDSDVAAQTEPVQPAQAIYLAGHSLGGAMATLLTLMLRTDARYASYSSLLRGTYTYGAPMVGTPELAEAADAATFGGSSRPLHELVLRYVYAADVVPQLPPKESGAFAHFGRELHCEPLERRRRPTWEERDATDQTSLLGLAIGGLALFTRQLVRLRSLPLEQSIADHFPHHYLDALRPPGVRSEYGG